MSAKEHSPSRPADDPSGDPPPPPGEEALSSRQAAERLASERGSGGTVDAVQDILLSLLRRTEELGKKTLEQWRRFLNGALWNKGRAAAREASATRRVFDERRKAPAGSPEVPSAESGALGAELAATVESLLSSLPPRERRVFLLVEWRRLALRTAAILLHGADGPDEMRQVRTALIASRRRIARSIQGWSAEERAAIFEGVDAVHLGALLEKLAAELGLQDDRPEHDGKKKN